MKENRLYDITEAGSILDTTSRTLRFYEEKGIIQSTICGISSRRKYTEEQIYHIRNVLVLRALGLSIKTISELQSDNRDLKEAILSKRAEILASVDKRVREINLLNEALSIVESGENIYIKDWQRIEAVESEEKQIASMCAYAIVNGNTDTLFEHLSSRMASYMPKDVYETARNETFLPLGEFVSFNKMIVDERYPNKLYQFVKYSKLGLKLTFVFHNKKIDGLWLGYYNDK